MIALMTAITINATTTQIKYNTRNKCKMRGVAVIEERIKNATNAAKRKKPAPLRKTREVSTISDRRTVRQTTSQTDEPTVVYRCLSHVVV